MIDKIKSLFWVWLLSLLGKLCMMARRFGDD